MRPQSGPKNRRPRGENYCDFCGSIFVLKLYACNNFEWYGEKIFKTWSGRWAACGDCATMIDLGAWEALVSHVMRYVHRREPKLPQEELTALREDLRLLYLTLKKNLRPSEALTVLQPHYHASLTG